ncbi:hypothetical protein [Arthrobacter sp. zg-Y769]|uniref:hypothetical protein n=1 Tax=Arthrobacter sp. zg-Y769 TaxID=2894191 RepID=UPI001E499331|nr:hypothetical protein [Arthrobacter sp. zg-Y769]MCC9206330.1 hypothetical protein [Arthrobacter sp. zg-Y769]
MIAIGALLVGGLVYMLITGIAAFKGTWRTWAAGRSMYMFGKNNYLGFFGLYLQLLVVVAILLTIWGELGADWITGEVMALILTPFMLLAFACCFRLPRFLLPQWYKDWLDRGANKDEVRKPEYSSPFTWLRRGSNAHR